jgi:hypothetical protein
VSLLLKHQIWQENLIYQNRNREDIVPMNVMQRMMKKAEIPAKIEAYEVLYYIN